MQENDEKRIERTVVWLDAKLVPRMDGWLAADNCKNRSEFINKALRFYMGYLGTEDNTAYLSQAILTAIQGTLDTEQLSVVSSSTVVTSTGRHQASSHSSLSQMRATTA